MYRKAAMTLLALALGGAFVLASTPASAQRPEQKQEQHQGKARGGGGGKNAIAPRGGNRAAAPHGNRSFGQRTSGPRSMTQRRVHTATPRTMTQRKMRTAHPRAATERKARTFTERNVRGTPRIGTPRSGRPQVAGGGEMRRAPLRGISRMHAGGRNYSVWRGKHRVRHNNGWRNFVAVGALSTFAIGSSDYYPYAYVSAEESYCSGLTDEGCQLHWREAETIEGDVIYRCVAYCPWR